MRFLKRSFVLFVYALSMLLCLSSIILIIYIRKIDRNIDRYGEGALYYQPAPTPGYDLDVLEADAEIKIPANAQEIHGMISGFRELDTWVRLDLPISDLPDFIESSRCTQPLLAVDPAKYGPGELSPDWWKPHQATRLEMCIGIHDYIFQRVLVDYSQIDMVTIYVFSATDNYTHLTTLTPKPHP